MFTSEHIPLRAEQNTINVCLLIRQGNCKNKLYLHVAISQQIGPIEGCLQGKNDNKMVTKGFLDKNVGFSRESCMF